MKPLPTLRAACLLALLAFVGTSGASELVSPTQSGSYTLFPVGEDGVSGVVYVADFDLEGTLVVIRLEGAAAGARHPAHFHSGDCGSGGGVVAPLEDIDGDTGLSVSFTRASYETIVGGDHHLNVHQAPDDMGTIIACGDIGPEADMVTAEPVIEDEEPATEVRPEEFEALRTRGYGIFAVGGIGGQVQIAERVEGGTRITVSLDGIDREAQYPAVIRRGDCGSQGEVVVELVSVPLAPGETASITESEVSYDALVEEDNFIEVYAPGGETIVACGEVGVGALR